MTQNTLKHRNTFKLKKYYIIVLLLVVLSVGYALIKSSYGFNGVANVSGKLNIYFDDLIVSSGSITTSTPATIDEDNKLSLSFGVVLSKPNDYYEFEVDVVNDSSSNAVLSEYVVPEIPDTYKKYVVYDITYLNGRKVKKDDVFYGLTRKRIKVRVSFNDAENIIDIIGPNSIAKEVSIPLGFEMTFEEMPARLLSDAIIDNLINGEEVAWLSDSSLDFSNALLSAKAGYYMMAGTESNEHPIRYYRGAVTNNNVAFGGYCWKIIRTTDDGGIRLLYNGVYSNGSCDTSNITIGSSAFNNNSDALNYVGYMYDNAKVYNMKTENNPGSGFWGIINQNKYGKTVSYNGQYTLNDTKGVAFWGNTSWNGDLDQYHYTCFSTSSSCSPVSFVFKGDESKAYYISLDGEQNIDEALANMIGHNSNTDINKDDSTIKTVIDTWYEDNLSSYASYLEDTEYCNDRKVDRLVGWNDTGAINGDLSFNATDNLSCENNNDRFSVDSKNGNGKLKYPIGLITKAEANLMGRVTATNYWTMTPSNATTQNVQAYYISATGNLVVADVNTSSGVRPVITIRGNATFNVGNGTIDDPYVVE